MLFGNLRGREQCVTRTSFKTPRNRVERGGAESGRYIINKIWVTENDHQTKKGLQSGATTVCLGSGVLDDAVIISHRGTHTKANTMELSINSDMGTICSHLSAELGASLSNSFAMLGYDMMRSHRHVV